MVSLYINVYNHEKHTIKKSMIEETILVPFQDMTVPIPKDYDAYLKHLYGDYMTLPKQAERCGKHNLVLKSEVSNGKD